MYMPIRTHMHPCARAHTLCVYVCIYVCMYIYIYIYTHTQVNKIIKGYLFLKSYLFVISMQIASLRFIYFSAILF